MKNKLFKIFIAVLCIFSFISVTSFVFVNNAKADSGWDSDYDSGGSDWGGGSDWDSDSGWDSDSDYSDWSNGSSSSIGSAGVISTIITIIVFMYIMYKIISSLSMPNNKRTNNLIPTKLSNEQINKVDPNLDIEDFKNKGYDIYKEIQYAWMNFDYEKLRQLTTDEIYNMYSMQLDTLQVKAEKNVMSDFVLIDSYISNIYIQNNVETVEFILKVNFYDYVVDSSNKIVRGSDKFKLEITYKLTFVKIVGPNDNNYCPNCGAKLEDKASTECPYCKSVIVSDNYTWVMSKKESLGQRSI